MLRNREARNFDAGKTAGLYALLGGSSVLAIAGAIGCVLRSGKAMRVAAISFNEKHSE